MTTEPSACEEMKALAAKFWPLAKAQASGCWEWQGGVDKSIGYGYLSFRGRKIGAHRMAFMLAHGEIPAGAMICHHCDNPPCVNPDHLYAGNAKTNIRDAINRGRAVFPPTDPEVHVRGEGSPNALLTAENVVEMRRIMAAGGTTFELLALSFGVSMVTARDAVHGKTWAHLPLAIAIPPKKAQPPKKSNPRKHVQMQVRGERVGNARLDSNKALEIRKRAIAGVTEHQLAHDFGVKKSTVHDVISGRCWRHVTSTEELRAALAPEGKDLPPLPISDFSDV